MAESILPGGPAALNGFLYQILANLDHVARAQLPSDGSDPDTLTVVLEPSAGDAQYVVDGSPTIVEQYKTKSGGLTWNTRSLVEQVLPDLLKAVEVGRPAVYRFVTDGREGRWGHLRRISTLLGREDATVEPGDWLDDLKPQSFFNEPRASAAMADAAKPRESWEHPRTDRQFFAYVCRKLRPATTTDTAAHAIQVRQLLACLQLQADASEEAFESSVDSLLSQVVERREDVQSKRQELCGILLKLSTIGSCRITATDLLAKAGLRAQPIHSRAQLARRCLPVVERTLAVFAYEASQDVRPLAPLGDAPIVILGGESGVGKTWALCALARQLLSESVPTVVVRARGDADLTLQVISDTIWVEARGMDGTLTLAAVHRRLEDMLSSPARQGQALDTLCVVMLDDVQDIQVAQLIAEKILGLPGFRLVASAPDLVGNALQARLGRNRSEHRPLKRLTLVQLRQLLISASIPHDGLPAEFRELLKLPVLARLYCEVGRGDNWVAESEYALFKRYYDRTWAQGEQPTRLEDRARLLKLVEKTVRSGEPYPWDLPCEGLAESVDRLSRTGLIRPTADKLAYEVWHDRILNWLVAEALLAARLRRHLQVQELSDLLAGMYPNSPGPGGRRFGYVPMDYLWLSLGAAGASEGVQDALHVVAGLATASPDQGLPRSLYEAMLPTLGPRTVPVYQQLLEALDPNARQSVIASQSLMRGLVKLGSAGAANAIAAMVDKWLSGTNEQLIVVAIELAAFFPRSELLDRLWAVHCELDRRVEQLDRAANPAEAVRLGRIKQRCVEALRKAASQSAAWLPDRFRDTSEAGDLVGLCYVLVGVERPMGEQIWRDVKDLLFGAVPANQRRVLALCVREFRDLAEADRMVSWLSDREDRVGGTAFAALAHMDPSTAVVHIPTVMTAHPYTMSWWAPLLLQTRRAEAVTQILAFLKTAKNGLYAASTAFRDLKDEVDGAVWDFVLEQLQQRLPNDLERGLQNTKGGFASPFEFIVNVTRADALARLRQCAGTCLERDIGVYAAARLDRFDDFGQGDDVAWEATQLLQRIGGEEYELFVLKALRHSSLATRRLGLNCVLHFEPSVTLPAVLQLARSAAQRTAPSDHKELGQALALLLLLGDTESVVDLCSTSAYQATPELLGALRTDRKALPDPPKFGAEEMLDPLRGPHTIVVAAIHGSDGSLALVREVLQQASIDSVQAKTAAEVLLRLGHGDDTVRQALARMLRSNDNHRFAAEALLGLGTEDSWRTLLDHYGGSLSAVDSDRDVAWFSLLSLLDTSLGEKATQVLRTWYEQHREPIAREFLRYLPRLGVANAHERLLDLASTDHERLEQQYQAVAGLFSIDREAALGCAQRLLPRLHGDTARRKLADLVNLGGEDSLSLLCGHALQEDDVPTREHIGRSLRALPAEAVEGHLKPMIGSPNGATRLRAIELAGWRPAGFLGAELAALATDDPEPDVRMAAAAACRRQRSEELTLELMAELDAASEVRLRVGLVTALVERVDPFLAESGNDPLCVYGRLQSAFERDYAHVILGRRRDRGVRA